MICSDTLEQYPILRSNGPPFRNSDDGPENDLVSEFVKGGIVSLSEPVKKRVFREPRIGAGFPDVVVGTWIPKVAEQWGEARLSLEPEDLQVVEALRNWGLSGQERIEAHLGREIGSALCRLHDAGLVYRATHSWGVRSLGDIFSLKRLIAIEAKVDDWATGLQQAARTRWFAGESYLLLGQAHVSDRLLTLCSLLGIGLLQLDRQLDNPVAPAKRRSLPRSHVSWLFNEWMWRAQLGDSSEGAGQSNAA